MRVHRIGAKFVIVRGRTKESFFSFFVDDDRSCWNMHAYQARQYDSLQDAHNDIGELKRRAHLRKARNS